MRRLGSKIDKKTENALREILKSQAKSRIYLFLLRKKKAKTGQIIKGTKLHPSTVRETLSKMHNQKLVFRKKLKNDNIGKNPFLYYPIPPVELLKRYAGEIEEHLNKIARLATPKEKNYRPVRIRIKERLDKT